MRVYLFLIVLVICSGSAWSPSRTMPRLNEPNEMQGIVSRHNYWRVKAGVPPLRWSNRLARIAKRWTNHLRSENCRVYHSPGNKYGENIYWSIRMENTPASVVDEWASEIQFFNPKTGRCKRGECSHYTQMVWKNTTKIGCAMVRCGEKEIWVCTYAPAGNWVGQNPY
jgi:pathogenesis-related protein 1